MRRALESFEYTGKSGSRCAPAGAGTAAEAAAGIDLIAAKWPPLNDFALAVTGNTVLISSVEEYWSWDTHSECILVLRMWGYIGRLAEAEGDTGIDNPWHSAGIKRIGVV